MTFRASIMRVSIGYKKKHEVLRERKKQDRLVRRP
jgi:hypothetical protein